MVDEKPSKKKTIKKIILTVPKAMNMHKFVLYFDWLNSTEKIFYQLEFTDKL